MTYQQHAKSNIDWANRYKLDNTVESYFFRYNNYQEYLKTGNETVLKTAFGRTYIKSIIEDIQWWFNKSIGAYNELK